jgi:hypothetical protein
VEVPVTHRSSHERKCALTIRTKARDRNDHYDRHTGNFQNIKTLSGHVSDSVLHLYELVN